MEIVYLSQYFPPEMGAPSARVSELAKFWSQSGHNVTVITGMPNHPDGIIHPKYKWEYFVEEYSGKVRVLRALHFITPNSGVVKRVWGFLSFTLSSFLVAIQMKKPGIIIATSPQMFIGLAGLAVSRLRGVPFVFEVRDIWPQSAVELNMIRSRFIIHVMEKIEKLLYSKAAAIIVVVESMRENIKSKVAQTPPIYYIPNGIDTERFDKKCPEAGVLSEKADSAFKVGYIGTFGLAHGLEIMIKAAELSKGMNIEFHLVGSGAERSKLLSMVREKHLNNVFIHEKVEPEKVPCIVKEMDAGFVHLRNFPLASEAIPSKMFEIMASGLPVIAGIRGYSKKMIESNECGWVFEPENINEFMRILKKVSADRDLCKRTGANAKNFVYKNYNRKNLAEEYSKILQGIT